MHSNYIEIGTVNLLQRTGICPIYINLICILQHVSNYHISRHNMHMKKLMTCMSEAADARYHL